MSLRAARRCAVILAVTIAIPANTALAQTPNRNAAKVSASISGINQFDADLDDGGNAGWSGFIISGAYSQPVAPRFDLGVTLRYDYQKWRFSDPVAFGGASPWQNLNAIAFGLSLDYAYQDDLRLSAAPVFGWSYATGASASNAMNYGAVLSMTKLFSPRLMLGGGVSVFRQIDETKVFPFVIVQWQIDDRWRLANPFRAGPAGGAGIELAYAVNDTWEIAGGGAYRSSRFRLDDSGIAPGGVGESRLFPAFVRATHKMGAQTTLEIYAGVSAGGHISATDKQGHKSATDYQSAPAVGLTLAHRL